MKDLKNLGKTLNRNEQKQVNGGEFGTFGCNTGGCNDFRLRCCSDICVTFDPRFDALCGIF